MASLLHLTRSRSAYRFEVIVSKVMLILPASLAESKDAVRIHCVLRRNNKVYKTGHLSLTPQDGTLSGDFASTLTFPCTLYWGKDAFDKKAFSVAVLLEDKPLEFTGTIDLAAFASHEKAMSADAEVKLSPAGSISFHLASHLSEDGDEVDGEVEEEIVAIDKTRKELSATRREPSGNKLVPLRLLSPPPVVTSGQGNALFQSFQPIDHKEDQTPLSPGSANPLSPLSPTFGAGLTSPPPVPPSSPFSPSSPLSPDGARSPASPLPFALVKNSQAPVAPLAVYPTEVPFTHTRRHSLSGPVQESPKPADRSLNPQKPPSPTNADKNRLSPSSRPTRLPSASGFVATVPLSQAAASRAFQDPSEAADTPSSGNLSAPQSSSAGTSPRVHSAQELDALNSVSSILMGADPSKR